MIKPVKRTYYFDEDMMEQLDYIAKQYGINTRNKALLQAVQNEYNRLSLAEFKDAKKRVLKQKYTQ